METIIPGQIWGYDEIPFTTSSLAAFRQLPVQHSSTTLISNASSQMPSLPVTIWHMWGSHPSPSCINLVISDHPSLKSQAWSILRVARYFWTLESAKVSGEFSGLETCLGVGRVGVECSTSPTVVNVLICKNVYVMVCIGINVGHTTYQKGS